MRVLISGATGLVGTEVRKQLLEQGHEPISLVRRSARNSSEVSYDPVNGVIDANVMNSIDAVVNLAGATTGKLPWTRKYKAELIQSRVETTRLLVSAILAAENPPKVLVSGSASGIYGDAGDAWLDETSPVGTGFLAELASAWEAEALKAEPKTRVVLARTTMVMSRKLGALGRLLPLLRAGVGGRLGSGKQWWAFISLPDEAGAIIHLINDSNASGAYNITAPEPATCAQLVQALGKALHRPTIVPVPAFALRLAFGEGADELLLCSQKMSATRLLETGFVFKHPTLQSAAQWSVGKD
jgi:uncharacterized protein (TIGR01777 family)